MMHERTMVCIVCPKGCKISISLEQKTPGPPEIIDIQGFSCPRGKTYAEQEIFEPRRILTTTVRTSACGQKRLAVRSKEEIPLGKLREVVAELRGLCLVPPISAGVCILRNPSGTDGEIIASDDLL